MAAQLADAQQHVPRRLKESLVGGARASACAAGGGTCRDRFYCAVLKGSTRRLDGAGRSPVDTPTGAVGGLLVPRTRHVDAAAPSMIAMTNVGPPPLVEPWDRSIRHLLWRGVVGWIAFGIPAFRTPRGGLRCRARRFAVTSGGTKPLPQAVASRLAGAAGRGLSATGGSGRRGGHRVCRPSPDGKFAAMISSNSIRSSSLSALRRSTNAVSVSAGSGAQCSGARPRVG